MPAPVVVRPGLDGVRPWLGAGGGLLYVALPAARPRPFGGARLRGPARRHPRPRPARAGRRRAARLAGRLLAADPARPAARLLRRPRPGQRRGRAAAGRVHLPAAPQDRGTPDGPQRETGTLSVTVQWVAADPGTASVLFAAARDTQTNVRDPVKVGDAAYALGVPSGTVMMRVGRTIVTVTAGHPGRGDPTWPRPSRPTCARPSRTRPDRWPGWHASPLAVRAALTSSWPGEGTLTVRLPFLRVGRPLCVREISARGRRPIWPHPSSPAPPG